MLTISRSLAIPSAEIELSAVRAQGAGGQNVNKVATAIHLRFDVRASSLPDTVKKRLLSMPDQRINADGVIVIKAQRFRSQEKNRNDALQRLRQLVASATAQRKRRVPTKPGAAAKQRRLDKKRRQSQKKSLRGSALRASRWD